MAWFKITHKGTTVKVELVGLDASVPVLGWHSRCDGTVGTSSSSSAAQPVDVATNSLHPTSTGNILIFKPF